MRTDRWMRVGRVVTAAAIGGSIMGGARAHASSDGYVTVGAGMFANEYTSGPLRQLAGGGERVITGHFGVGSDGSLVVGGGDVQLAVALNASGHACGQRRPFLRAWRRDSLQTPAAPLLPLADAMRPVTD